MLRNKKGFLFRRLVSGPILETLLGPTLYSTTLASTIYDQIAPYEVLVVVLPSSDTFYPFMANGSLLVE